MSDNPYVVPGVDASAELRADLITAKGGAELEDERLHRPRVSLPAWWGARLVRVTRRQYEQIQRKNSGSKR